MDSGGAGRIYSLHETLCTVIDIEVSGLRGAGRCGIGIRIDAI